MKHMMLLKRYKFVKKKGKGIISERKVKAWSADKDLSSWGGLDGTKMTLSIKHVPVCT